MDPQAALDLAARAYRRDDFEEAFEALNNYFEWRRSGGFEPRGGDKRARGLLDKLVRATGGYESGWEEGEYVEGYENPGYGLHLQQFPAGTWGFVGTVPGSLAFVTKEGKQPTAKHFEQARSFGPRLAGVKTRSWKTKAAALRAAKAEGYDPEKVKGHGLVSRSSPKRKTKNPKVKTKTKKATNVRSLVAKAMK